ncbi:hypothetical protein [Aureimonas sp. SK2]|uniref:hypothetical protein n=1 Tax=Aureimonas sp. SK2 TaxID=3015992 RepID=UPI002444F24B|nr:hypothetical protein [Aureimonas sp. SK2]
MLTTSTTTTATFDLGLFLADDEYDAHMESIAAEMAAFSGGVEKSRDVHFHIPGNEDGQEACKARLAHHGVTLAAADTEAAEWPQELRDVLFAIVEDVHARRLLGKRWQRVGEAVTRLPAAVRQKHPGYAQVAFEVVEGHRSRLNVDHRRAMYAFGF